MRNSKIILAELDINFDSLIKSQKQIESQMNSMMEKRDKMLVSEGRFTEGVKKLSAEIDTLYTTYNLQAKTVNQQLILNDKRIAQQQALERILVNVNATENEYIRNSEELIKQKKALNVNDDNYVKNIELINVKLQENNNWLNENGSAHAKLITTMSDYQRQVVDSFNSINVLNGGMTGLISRAQEAGGAGPLLKSAFEGMSLGIMGMTKSSIAFIATPVGATIAALAVAVGIVVGAFKFMTASMNSTEEGSQKLARVTASITGAFNTFWKLLKPLGEFMGNAFVAYFDLVSTAIGKVMDGLEAAARFVGMDSLADSIGGFKDAVAESSKAAADLAKAEGELVKMQRLATKTQLDYQKQAEKLRQLRDDESKTLAEREKANISLGKVLDKQAKDELKTALKAKEVADLRIKSEGARTEHINELAEAETKIAEIEERIEGQRSEQLANQNSLRKEGIALSTTARQAILDEAAKAINLELELLKQSQREKFADVDVQIKNAELIRDKKIEALDAEYAAGKKTANDLTKLNLDKDAARLEFMEAQTNAVLNNSEKELTQLIADNKTKIDNNKFLTEEAVKEELNRLTLIRNGEAELLKDSFDAKLISEQDYRIALQELDEQLYNDRLSIEQQRRDAEQDRQLIDIENKKLSDQVSFEEKLQLELDRLDILEQAEIAASDKTGAAVAAIEEKYATQRRDIERSLNNFKIEQNAKTAGDIATLLGKNSKVGKAFAIAEATYRTYLAAQAAYTSQMLLATPDAPIRAAIAAGAAVAVGLRNVASIASTKEPKFEQGGLLSVGGNRHSNGGTLFTGADGTRFEAEQGELIGVMNRNAATHFMVFNNAFPAGGGASAPNYFASGGIVSREIASPGLNVDDLAAKIALANAAIPAPIVAVQDIITQSNSFVQVREAANF